MPYRTSKLARRTTITKGNTNERIFLVPDIHAGDSDPRAIELAARLCNAFRPSYVVFMGDILDSGWASTFPQNLAELPGQLEREIEEWERIKKLFPYPSKVIPGNHDYRIIRWGWNQPALFNFKPLTLQSLIGLPIIEEGYVKLAQGNFTLTHGSIVRRWSGQSAKAEMEKWGTGGASGHTHRGAVYLHRDGNGVKAWAELGCLQRNPPKYAPINNRGPQNWQQGVGTLELEGNAYNVEFHPFTLSYSCSFGGKRYKA